MTVFISHLCGRLYSHYISVLKLGQIQGRHGFCFRYDSVCTDRYAYFNAIARPSKFYFAGNVIPSAARRIYFFRSDSETAGTAEISPRIDIDIVSRCSGDI